MPPKLKTMSSEANVRLRVSVINSGMSPRYSHHANFIPRAARISISLAKCLSARLPRMISSPMMIAPTLTPAPRPLDGLAAQFTETRQTVVNEHQPAVDRHHEADQGYMSYQSERDSEKKQ